MKVRQVLANSERVRLAYRAIIRWGDRIDDPRVRAGRHLAQAIRKDPPGVLFFGDSVASFISLEDVDRRPLDQMVAEGLADHGPVHSIHGGAYHPALFTAYVNLLRGSDARPLVIVPLVPRFRQTPWLEHPAWNYATAVSFLRGVDPKGSPRKIRARAPGTSPEDFDSLHAIRFPTLVGDLTIGEYMGPLKEARRRGESSEELVRLLYAYHHGGRLEAGSAVLDAVTELAQTLEELGCPVVTYETAVAVERGVELFGAEFADHVRHNFAVVADAFRRGTSDDTVMIESGTAFADNEFVNPDDATEHLNEVGRRRLAEMIVTAARDRLAG